MPILPLVRVRRATETLLVAGAVEFSAGAGGCAAILDARVAFCCVADNKGLVSGADDYKPYPGVTDLVPGLPGSA